MNGIVLNTSFALHGEPVVLGPCEARQNFLWSGRDTLAMENRLLEKDSFADA